MKYIVGVIVVALLAVVGYYAWDAYGGAVAPPPPPPPPPAVPTLLMYATSTFSIQYRDTYALDDSYTYNAFEGKPISGVKFSVPTAMTVGTNLSNDSYVSVEWLPRAQNCTGDIYVLPNVRATDLLVGSTTYSVATTSEAAAGNVYEEQVYAIVNSDPCTAVRYYIHATQIENYEPGTVQEYDRSALMRAFDAVRDSLMLNH